MVSERDERRRDVVAVRSKTRVVVFGSETFGDRAVYGHSESRGATPFKKKCHLKVGKLTHLCGRLLNSMCKTGEEKSREQF
jgi:hypothetical protein